MNAAETAQTFEENFNKAIMNSRNSSAMQTGHRNVERGGLLVLIRRLFHWGPLVAMGIIKFVFFTCIYLTSWWLPPYETLGGTINHVMYMMAVGLILYNFLCSVGAGGGFVPKGWKPVSSMLNKGLSVDLNVHICNIVFMLNVFASMALHCTMFF